MKTLEGYEVERVSPYTVRPYLYGEADNLDVLDNGFCGWVMNTNSDDRFTVPYFCVWNSEGIVVCRSTGCHGPIWGRQPYYQIVFN